MLILKVILAWIALVAVIIAFCYVCFVIRREISFYTDKWIDEEDNEILPILSYKDAKLYHSMGLVGNQSHYYYTHFTIKDKRFTFKNFFDYYRFVSYIEERDEEKALDTRKLKQEEAQKELQILLQNVLQEQQVKDAEVCNNDKV